MRSPGGGESSLSACPGVGNRLLSEKKIANPRACAGGGGMVTGRIEPCISRENTTRRMQIACLMAFDTVFDGMFVFHKYLPSRS